MRESEMSELTDVMEECCCTQPYSYSGRGQYGARCFAFNGGISDLASFFAVAALELGAGDVDRLVQKVRMDSMGLRSVFYFPGIPYDGAGEEE
jgi:hypothetical protein